MKINGKWVKYKLLEGDRVQYKDLSYLWKMINEDDKILTKHLTPTKEWGVLCGVNNFMDLRELDRRYGSLSSRRTHPEHFALNLDKARKVNEARKRFKDQLEHPRNGGKYLLPESWTIFRSLKPKQTNIL